MRSPPRLVLSKGSIFICTKRDAALLSVTGAVPGGGRPRLQLAPAGARSLLAICIFFL